MTTSSLAPVLLVAMPQLQDPNFHRSVVLLVEHSADGALGLVLNREGDLRLADLCKSLEIQWTGDPEASTDWGGPVEPNKGWMLFADAPGGLEPTAMSPQEADPSSPTQSTHPEHTNGDTADECAPQPSAEEYDASSELVFATDSDTVDREAYAESLLDEEEDDEDDAQEILDGVYFGVTLDTLRNIAEHSKNRFRLFLGYAAWGPGQLENEMARGDWIIAPADAGSVFDCRNEELWNQVISSLGVDPTHLVSATGIH